MHDAPRFGGVTCPRSIGPIVSAFDHINLSREPDYVIRQWLTVSNAIKAALRVISLPDTCPGKSPLPTGTAFLTDDPGWRRFALSDVGCGMCVVRTRFTATDANSQAFRALWDALCDDLAERRNRGLGDLGSGNHFLDAEHSRPWMDSHRSPGIHDRPGSIGDVTPGFSIHGTTNSAAP